MLGAGIQGSLAALALEEAGFQVTLYEKKSACMTRASLHNEGKIHLGFVYANEPGRRTARLMVESAVLFGPLLERWLPPFAWDELISHPFDYVVMPDSMVGVGHLEEHYAFVEGELARLMKGSDGNYCGARPERIVERLPAGYRGSLSADFEPLAQFRTAEVALEPSRLRALILDGFARRPRIMPRTDSAVERVSRVGADLEVTSRDSSGHPVTDRFEVVVNCLWEDRLRVDGQMGLPPPTDYSHRLKYIFVGPCRRPASGEDRSLTLVLGPFGDYVRYPSGEAYFSWYPSCLQGWSNDLVPPGAWEADCEGRRPHEWVDRIRQESVERFGAILPTIRESTAMEARAGIICAQATKDIDRPDSELHGRTRAGVTRVGGYLSVDTGKLTCAPMHASEVARLLVGKGTG